MSRESAVPLRIAREERSGLDCPHCGYDLRGMTEPRCPECGRHFILVSPDALRRPPHPPFLATSSMWCPACGTLAGGLMPKHCGHCGRRFTLWERVFGVGGLRIG
jgi:rubrerythrin